LVMDTAPIPTVTAPRQAWHPWNAEHYGERFCYPLPLAAALIGVSPAEVGRLLARRRAHQAVGRLMEWDVPEPIPAPPGRADTGTWWVKGRWQMWAWQLGVHLGGYEGLPVIGVLGLAKLTGRRPQSLRKVGLASDTNPTGLPRPVLRIVNGAVTVNLFDPDEARRWCVWTRRLSPTGVPLPAHHPGRGVAVDP
jgi:hypothetical protein